MKTLSNMGIGLMLATTLVLVGSYFVLPGCAASKALQHVALPEARAVFPRVAPEIELALAFETDPVRHASAKGGLGLVAGSLAEPPTASAASAFEAWPALESYGRSGVAIREQRGEIGPGAVQSFHERLRLFGALLGRIAGR